MRLGDVADSYRSIYGPHILHMAGAQPVQQARALLHHLVELLSGKALSYPITLNPNPAGQGFTLT
jgi:hypothetical protein